MDVHAPPPPPGGPGNGDHEPEGPPPPPFVRARRRRRRILAVVLGVLVTALLAALAVVLVLRGSQTTAQPDEAAPQRPDREVAPEERLDRFDPGAFEGPDHAVAEMLLDIDAAERSMIGFQADAEAALTQPDPEDPDAPMEAVATAAGDAREELAVLRQRLGNEQTAAAAERVRTAYLGHLDAWVAYLAAIEEEPQVVLGEELSHTLDISRTGDDFVRAVRRLEEADLAAAVTDFADDIVQRGFASSSQPQV